MEWAKAQKPLQCQNYNYKPKQTNKFTSPIRKHIIGSTMPTLHPSITLATLITSGAKDPALYNNLITLYSKSPSTLPQALHLFNNLPFKPTTVSWTSIISAHSPHSPPSSLALFLSMLRSRALPNQGTISSLLRTFSSSLPLGLQLHSLSLKLSLNNFPFSGSALVHFYANSGLPGDALKVFDEILHRDEVCYGAAIVGLAQNDRASDAIRLFGMMRRDGIRSSMYDVSGVLRAAAYLAALEQTRVVHAHAVVVGLDSDFVVGTALVDAYGKSGIVSDARRVFDCFVDDGCNLVTWNAMLAAYAQQGDAEAATKLFDEMIERGNFVPDEVTFLAVLTACSNTGLVAETRRWLDLMRSHYGVEPRIEHCTCLVGAMARVGQLEDAERFARTMPFEPDAAVWRTLLSGCMVHNSVELGRKVARRLIEIDPRDESAYVMLANIYSTAGWKDEVGEVLTEMRDGGVRKERGRSWIEVKGQVNDFIAGDMKHEQTMEIYDKVKELANEAKRLS